MARHDGARAAGAAGGIALLLCLAGVAAGCGGEWPAGTLSTAVATETACPDVPAGRTEAVVVWVVDGDTIHVEIEGQEFVVRYIGIDAPEVGRPDHPEEWMGPEATEANRRLVENEVVWLESDVSETDQYGRLLRYVWLADSRMVNEELVRTGFAVARTYPPDVKHQDRLIEAEREARAAEAGLWGPAPTAEGGE
jgi:micrococcal nuclease